MVDLVPLVILVFGTIAAIKPGWIAALHRRQKAAGTTTRPGDIEVSESFPAVVRLAGVAFALFGLFFVFRSL